MSLDARPGENGPHIDSPHLHQSQQVTTVSRHSTRQKSDRRTVTGVDDSSIRLTRIYPVLLDINTVTHSGQIVQHHLYLDFLD
ncbi:hypothetical protein MJO29_000465 [Puccinia striiformis f. sp. tritici]|nr:hypothetical protein MJO29_000465 [Puccinia striiformis f. sp. tritici]KAI9603622.1 hypothetical protein KEM48_000382 [Puccinia striiformis f. sp. tritici PST-130]